MKIVLVSKCSLDIEQYVKFKMLVLISPSKSLFTESLACVGSHIPTFTVLPIQISVLNLKQLV